MRARILGSVALVGLLSGVAIAQTPAPDAATWAADLARQYWVAGNITYLVADGYEAKIDVFVPRHASAAALAPAVIYLHGGGWTGGDKSTAALRVMPYLEMGFAAVAVNYRLALAPAAVEDCRCALRWVIANAAKYNIDPDRLVVTGESAGGHLALITGMLPSSAGLDGNCPGPEELRVAAIVNWYGCTDIVDVIGGENEKPFAVNWLGDRSDREEIARRVSPVQYVRAGLPPILTVHGDADAIAPYNHAVRLHEALEAARVPNRLLTVPGGDHGSFTREANLTVYAGIREFLAAHGIAR